MGEDDLHAVVDGQLAADRHREVMAYLAVYPDAADRVTAFFRQRVELAALREGLTDSEPGPKLAGLEEALCRVVRRQHRVRQALSAGSLAVMLGMALSGWWLATTPGSRSAPPPMASAAGDERRTTAGLTQAMLAGDAETAALDASDSAVLWLQAHLGGQSLKQPNLESLGLHFAGGETLKSARGPAIRLVYTDDTGRLYKLFVGVRQSGVELAASLVPEHHISLTWQQDPLVFSLVAPQGSARLGEIMRSASDLLDPAPVAADAGVGVTGEGEKAGSGAGDGLPDVPLGSTLEGVVVPEASPVSKPL